jgi:signal transduction histidine kinase
MGRLIGHHLGRAAAVAGSGRTLGVRTPVRPVADAVVAMLGKVYAGRKLSIATDVPPDLAFRGHREDLEEILGNLLENACKWARQRVRLVARGDGGELRIEVEDDGPGMPADQTEAALRRGRRLDEKVPGWGLGLSIVSDLVDVNGGEMNFGSSSLGGLSVVVTIPRP